VTMGIRTGVTNGGRGRAIGANGMFQLTAPWIRLTVSTLVGWTSQTGASTYTIVTNPGGTSGARYQGSFLSSARAATQDVGIDELIEMLRNQRECPAQVGEGQIFGHGNQDGMGKFQQQHGWEDVLDRSERYPSLEKPKTRSPIRAWTLQRRESQCGPSTTQDRKHPHKSHNESSIRGRTTMNGLRTKKNTTHS